MECVVCEAKTSHHLMEHCATSDCGTQCRNANGANEASFTVQGVREIDIKREGSSDGTMGGEL